MRFSYAESMTDPSFYAPLARAAEEAGYHSMVIPDSICYPLDADSTYPYSPDGSREFLEDKPFLEPFSLIPALGAVTSRMRFTTFVREAADPQPGAAGQAGDLDGGAHRQPAGPRRRAPARGARTTTCSACDWAGRGRRMDESIEILRGLAAGGYFEYHGESFDLPPVKIAPVPDRADPGAHRRPRGRRAAPCRPAGGRLDARRGRPGGPAPAARPPRRAPPRASGTRGAAVRGARDLGGRLHRGRRAPAGGAGRDRRDHRLPLALRDRPRHRAARPEDRQPPPVRRHRHRRRCSPGAPRSAQQQAGGQFQVVADVVRRRPPGHPGDQVRQPDVADDPGDGHVVG